MIVLHTINAYLLSKNAGHDYEYLLSVNKAAKINNWRVINYISKTADIEASENWRKVLIGHFSKNSISVKILKPLQNLFVFYKIFKKLRKSKDKNIIFLDNFSILQLFALFFAMMTSFSKFDLWLIHRYDL